MNESPQVSAWTLFRNGDFSRFCGSRVLSAAAHQMQNVAVGWLIYEVTRSPLALGLAGLAAFLPAVVLGLVVGHVADRLDRRLVIACAHVAGASASAGLYWLAGRGGEEIWPIYLFIVLAGSARAFNNPTSQALLPSLIERRQFPSAVAWSSSMMHLAQVVGPALGGLLYVFGPRVVFCVAGLCFAAALVSVLTIRFRAPKLTPEKASWTSVLAGIAYIRSNEVLLAAISLDLFAVLLSGAVALLPIYARDILHVGPQGFGLLRSMPSLGAVAMAILLAHRPLRRHVGRRMIFAVIVFGIAVIAFGVSRSLPLSLFCLFVLGASDMISVVVRHTLMQIETPDAMRGRVSAVSSIFIGASNELGEFEAGLLAALVGAVTAVVLGGVGTIGVALLWLRLFPALRDRDRMVEDGSGGGRGS